MSMEDSRVLLDVVPRTELAVGCVVRVCDWDCLLVRFQCAALVTRLVRASRTT